MCFVMFTVNTGISFFTWLNTYVEEIDDSSFYITEPMFELSKTTTLLLEIVKKFGR